MKKRYAQIIILFLVLILAALPASPIAVQAAGPEAMEVHFIDVGQGDATLITCGGHSMLIDAGDDSKGTAIQSYLMKQDVEKLDYLVLTHPDSDHIGGAPVIITKFDIDQVFMSDFTKDNSTYEKLIQALDYRRLPYETPKAGSLYSLGDATVTILGPVKTYDNPNDSSIVVSIRHGNNRFLFTGDSTEAAEEDLLDSGTDLSADVYHVGHHGSRTSTSDRFFQAVSPSEAVISCGEDNAYGHPHAQTLNTFRIHGVRVYRTDEDGTIVATSDGDEILFRTPPSETWKPGEPTQSNSQASLQVTYVLNTNTHKFHRPTCSSVGTIKEKNRADTTDSRDQVIGQGYVPCKNCHP